MQTRSWGVITFRNLCVEVLAARRGQRVVLVRDLLGILRDRELSDVGRVLQGKTGLTYRALSDGDRASGVYRRSIQLASGRFAMLDEGMGFSLVPWRPVTDRHLGQEVAAIVRGHSVSWQIGRRRGVTR